MVDMNQTWRKVKAYISRVIKTKIVLRQCKSDDYIKSIRCKYSPLHGLSIATTLLIITNLRRQVIVDMSYMEIVWHLYIKIMRQWTLNRKKKKVQANQERNIVTHHELYFRWKSGALRKVDKVFQRKGEWNMLVHLDEDALDSILFIFSSFPFFWFGGFRLFTRFPSAVCLANI